MRIALVVHGWPPGSLGGTEVYTASFARALARAGHEVLVIAAEEDPSRPDGAQRQESAGNPRVLRVNRNWSGTRTYRELYRSQRQREAVGRLLAREAPDVVHVQHLTRTSTDVLVDLARREVPVVVTLNDFWLLCQRGQMLDRRGRRCAGPHRGCRACAESAAGVGSGALALAPRLRRAESALPASWGSWTRRTRAFLAWLPRRPGAVERARTERLAHVRSLFDLPVVWHAPSRTVRDVFVEAGLPADRVVVVPQGIDRSRFEDLETPPPAAGRHGQRGGVLRVGFLGSLIPSKGVEVLLDALERLGPARERVELEVRGTLGDDHGRAGGSVVRARRLRSMSGVQWPGPLDPEDVPRFLSGIDVLAMPSVWLENSPRVVAEAFAAGVPVIASDLGGMAEAVRSGVDGLLFPVGDASALAEVLRRLVDDPDLLPALRQGVRAPRSIDEDAADWSRRYAAAIEARRSEPDERPVLAAVFLDHETPADTVLAVRALRRSRRRPDRILVVENGSSAEAVAEVRRRLPETEVLDTGRNLGFSGGANAGLRAALDAGAERVLLLNADVLVFPETIERLEAVLDSRPGSGPVGPVLLAGDRPDVVTSRGIGYRRWTGRMRHRSAGTLRDPEASPEAEPVAALAGCALLFDRDTLESVGLFEEGWWFSFEDLELGLRARRSGRQSLVAGDAEALHLGSRSIGPRSPDRLYYAARNHLRLAARARWLPPPLAALRSTWIVALTLAHAWTGGYPRHEGLRAIRDGAADYRKGVEGPRPGLPKP